MPRDPRHLPKVLCPMGLAVLLLMLPALAWSAPVASTSHRERERSVRHHRAVKRHTGTHVRKMTTDTSAQARTASKRTRAKAASGAVRTTTPSQPATASATPAVVTNTAHPASTSTTAGSGGSTPEPPETLSSASAAGPTAATTVAPTATSAGSSDASGATDPSTTGSTTTGGGGQLVWSDEFAGAAGDAPDPTKWTAAAGWGGGTGQLQTYQDDPGNVSLDGAGDLAITTRYAPTSAGGTVLPFTSGLVRTKGLYSFTYGSIQASIKLPAGDGLWPAFWAVGADDSQVGWPNCGEIDVMENNGNTPNVLWGSLHGPNGTPDGYSLNNMDISPTSLSDSFHTYGVNWSPTEIQFTLDGQVYATETSAELGAAWVFNQPFYLILNTAVNAQTIGDSSSTALAGDPQFPATMLVSWVRVYSGQ